MKTNPPDRNPPSLWRRPPSKHLALLGGLALLLVSPDMALFLIGQALHLVWLVAHFCLGWLELGFKHLVQETFDVSRHTAQIITAWTGLFVFLALFVWLYRKFAPRLADFLSNRRRTAESVAETADSFSEP